MFIEVTATLFGIAATAAFARGRADQVFYMLALTRAGVHNAAGKVHFCFPYVNRHHESGTIRVFRLEAG
jgi:hypothetical protein